MEGLWLNEYGNNRIAANSIPQRCNAKIPRLAVHGKGISIGHIACAQNVGDRHSEAVSQTLGR
jgi:hypothetical protein